MISVIIPTFNRSTMLCEAIESVLKQNNNDWECWIVDDFSTDDTKKIVEKYRKCDSKIHYCVNERKKGAQGARNTGIIKANGEWVILLDSDNLLEPCYVSYVYAYIQTHPEIDVVTNYFKIINEQGTEIGNNCHWKTEGSILPLLLDGASYVDNSSACIRRSKLFEMGLLDEKCPSFQEWDTHIRLSQISIYGYVPEFLTSYRDHHSPRVSQSAKSIWTNGLYVLKKHRNLWFETVGIDVYSHHLLAIYDLRRHSSLATRLKTLVVIVCLCPKLGKQLLKRSCKSF